MLASGAQAASGGSLAITLDLSTIGGFIALLLAVIAWALAFINARAHSKIDSNASKQDAIQVTVAAIAEKVTAIKETGAKTERHMEHLESHLRQDLSELDRRVRDVEVVNGYCNVPDRRKSRIGERTQQVPIFQDDIEGNT